MADDPPRDDSAPPSAAGRVCPHCLNPHTVVANQRYRGVLRFCPMCDYSWVVGQVTREPAHSGAPPRD